LRTKSYGICVLWVSSDPSATCGTGTQNFPLLSSHGSVLCSYGSRTQRSEDPRRIFTRLFAWNFNSSSLIGRHCFLPSCGTGRSATRAPLAEGKSITFPASKRYSAPSSCLLSSLHDMAVERESYLRNRPWRSVRL
jgi:hypothetical protein